MRELKHRRTARKLCIGDEPVACHNAGAPLSTIYVKQASDALTRDAALQEFIIRMQTVFQLPKSAALLAFLALILLQACSPYRINIQQGNFLDEETIAQVEPGMTRAQVKFLLGTPLVADSFNENRWDYVFHYRNGKTQKVRGSKFVVFFEGNEVNYIERVVE